MNSAEMGPVVESFVEICKDVDRRMKNGERLPLMGTLECRVCGHRTLGYAYSGPRAIRFKCWAKGCTVEGMA